MHSKVGLFGIEKVYSKLYLNDLQTSNLLLNYMWKVMVPAKDQELEALHLFHLSKNNIKAAQKVIQTWYLGVSPVKKEATIRVVLFVHLTLAN